MTRWLVLLSFAAVAVVAALAFGVRSASAALKTNARAPEFSLQAALGGTVETVDLKALLAKGPVVVYFFPKSFTSGCTVEAHAFSAAVADFAKYNATVVGISGDDIATQKRFSTQECRSAFLVASDPGLKTAKAYDAKLPILPISNRTSFVIAPNGTIAYTYTSLDPSKHVENTLAAVRALSTETHAAGVRN